MQNERQYEHPESQRNRDGKSEEDEVVVGRLTKIKDVLKQPCGKPLN